MVYCSKCGTKNPDEAEVCRKCREELYPLEKAVEREVETCFGPPRRRERYAEECFGFPRGWTIFTLLIGAAITTAGVVYLVGRYTRWKIEFWEILGPLLAIVFGVFILAAAAYGLSRR